MQPNTKNKENETSEEVNGQKSYSNRKNNK